jgi:hypothetical protein
MMQFKAFKPSGMEKIARSMGYQGSMDGFNQFLAQDPVKQKTMQQYQQQAMQMAKGGAVQKFAPGGTATSSGSSQFPPFTASNVSVGGGATSGGTPTTSSASSGGKTQQVVVYGPNGTMYSNPAAAKAAGVTNYTTTPPNLAGAIGTGLANAFGGTGAGTGTSASNLSVGDATVQRMYDPTLPAAGVVQAAPTATATDQFVDPTTGQVTGTSAVSTALANVQTATAPAATQANLMQANTAAPAVDAALNATQAAQANPQDPRAQVTAAQQTASSVGNLQAAQGNAILMNNPQQRQIQAGELISGTGVDATKAAAATAQTQAAAASAQPSKQATVQGQLADLMTQFQGGQTPAWAAGAMRNAMGAMAARGLGASSLAGQAMIQAAMESALPIAQADASVTAAFEQQNLSNRQQSAMLAAEQRAKFLGQEFDQAFQAKVQNAAKVADVANMNFTAEQQVALENSRIANTMNLQNLSNNQAMVMAEAAALSQLDMANLNNRQQAAVQNANSFLQVNMANLSNQQQTELFKSQQRVQALFTDQAAENAARQFNASSQNQVDQFFASLASQTAQFNASQSNAQAQFNAGQINTVERFNAEINNQRDQFNAQNQLVIAQSNAQWRREIATADTAAVNRANELNASAILDVSKQAYDNLWTYYADTMEWAWTSAENELNRIADMAIATLNADERAKVAAAQAKTAAGSAVGSLIGTLGSAFITAKFCWVGREVYGKDDPRWFVFRLWVKHEAPEWFRNLYGKHGKTYAEFIRNKPALKWMTKKLMDIVVERKEIRHAAY